MQPKRGFTLIELLTVIGILALLIAVLVPAVNGVRRQARVTTTTSTISALATGLEQFRADQRIGGKYAPSASDVKQSDRLTYRVANPYAQLNGHYSGDEIRQSGAGLLVWALAGADLLGPPGFKPTRSGSAYWGEDSDSRPRPRPGGIHSYEGNTRQPAFPRTAPLVDLSRVSLTPWDAETSSYAVPIETQIRTAMGQSAQDQPQRHYPMFLDAFDGPVLYWRADPAGLEMADETPSDLGNVRERGIYHYEDNRPLLIGNKAVWMTRNRNPASNLEPHDMQFDQSRFIGLMTGGGNVNVATELAGTDDEQLQFARAIQDTNVQARPTPQNKDTFILLSAGPDGIFGTTDDIGNIKINGGG